MQVGYDVTTCTAVLPYAREGIRKEGITTRQRRSRRSSAGLYGKRLGERVQKELDSVQRAIASVAPQEADRRLSIAFLYVRGTAGVFFILGQGSGADGLIKALSGVDAAGEAGVKDIKPATSEALATLNPDLILAMSKGVESAGGVDGLASRPGMGETTAGKNRRIVDMADGQILSFGPNAPAVLLSLARAIYAPDTTTSARPNP